MFNDHGTFFYSTTDLDYTLFYVFLRYKDHFV